MKCLYCENEATHVRRGGNSDNIVEIVCENHIQDFVLDQKFDPIWLFELNWENLSKIFEQINKDYEDSKDNWDGG